MENKIVEKCPKCGNFTQGFPTYSAGRKVTQKATTTATTKILGPLIGAIVGLPFGGIGAIPGAIIGLLVAVFISPKATEKIDNVIYDNTKLTFTCLGCGETWYKVIKTDTGNLVPDAVLQKEKDEIVAKYNKKASSHVWRIIVACIIFGIGLVLCMNGDTYTEGFMGMQAYSSSFIFSWILMIVSFPDIIYEVYSYGTNKNKANTYEQMSLSEFSATK